MVQKLETMKASSTDLHELKRQLRESEQEREELQKRLEKYIVSIYSHATPFLPAQSFCYKKIKSVVSVFRAAGASTSSVVTTDQGESRGAEY